MPRKGNIQNLKHFVKGDDSRRNLKGAPPKLPALDELLARVLSEEQNGLSAMEAIIMMLRAKAAKGDLKAAEILLDRGYGKPKQSIDNRTELEIKSIVKVVEIIEKKRDDT